MIGSRLGDRYELLRELGRGGMGVVYLAHDPRLEREVAVKIIPQEMLTADTEERFRREARLIARLDHPGIVVAYDVGADPGALFLVMPFVAGVHLHDFIREGATLAEIVEIGRQVAEALEYSHARGIVHRDVKPENILVTREGDSLRVRLTDFGIAMATFEKRFTQPGSLIGTIAYLSPEQVRGGAVTAQSDIFSFGSVLYECLAGEPPFGGDIPAALYRIANERQAPLAARAPHAAGALQSIVDDCLEKDPQRRPRSMSEVAAALAECAEALESDGAGATHVTAARRLQRGVRAQRAPLVGRDHELAQLESALNEVAGNGDAHFVAIAGDEGLGKSRLAEELEQLAVARGIPVYHARMHGFDQSLPYQGFGDIIQEYLRSPAATRSTPGSDFADVAGDLVEFFPALTELLDARYPGLAQRHERRRIDERTYIFEVLAKALIRIANGRPMVLLLEDVHTVDVTVEALQYVIRRMDHTPTLFVATYRATAIDKRHPLSILLSSFRGDRRFTPIVLHPLSTTEHRRLVELILGGVKVEPALDEKLFHATEGNPHFAIELVRSLLDAGNIAPGDSGAWRLTGERGIAADSLPATIKQAVEDRIERLPDPLRDFLSTAAVLGKTFDSYDLELLTDDPKFDDTLDRLVAARLLDELPESRGDHFTFSSGILRDVLYSRLSPRRRRALHRRFAERLEERRHGRAGVQAQLLHHYWEADVSEKVIEYGLEVARTALAAFSPDDVLRSGRLVLSALEDANPGNVIEADIHLLLAEAHRMNGSSTAALRELEIAAEEHASGERFIAVALLAAQIAWESRQFDAARKWVQRGVASAGPDAASDALLDLLALGATLANLRAEYSTAKDYLDRAEGIRAARVIAQPQRARGGTLSVAMLTPVLARHPIDLEIEEESEIYSTVFETLTSVDRDGNVVPLAAERWQLLDDGRAFKFVIHPRLRTSDGAAVTAADVKRALEFAVRQTRLELPASLAAIRGIDSDGEISGLTAAGNELLIELNEPLPILPALLGTPRTALAIPRGDAFLGTGPFCFESFASDSITVRRNEHYWRTAPALVDAIQFSADVSAAEMVGGLRSERFDIVRDLLPQDLDRVLRDRPLRASIAETPKKNIYGITFNVAGPVTRDANIRRAMAGVIDARDLVQRTIGRFAQPAEGLFPPGILGHDPGRRRKVMPLDEARALVPERITIRASVHPVLQDRYRELTTLLFDVWRSIGIDCTIETPTTASFVESWQSSAGFDLLIGRWNADYDDPDTFASGLFHSRFGAWRNYCADGELDELIERARVERSPAARSRVYDEFERALGRDARFVPLFHEIDYRVASRRVSGLQLRPARPYVNYTTLSKETPAAGIAPREGGPLRVPLTAAIWSLDPTLVSTVAQLEVVPNIFEPLTKHSEGAGIRPCLAEDFRADDAGARYYFRLRENVRFHDGRKLTSRDVRYTFERLLRNEESESRWLLAPIRGARALIDGTAKELSGFRILSTTEFLVDLEQPLSFFPALVAYEAACIVPEGAELRSHDISSLAGTGPFRISSFEPGKRLELEANRDYWIDGVPKSSALTFDFDVSPPQIARGFREGQYSMAWDLLPEDVEAFRRDTRFAATYRQTPLLATGILIFNIHRPPFDDESLRRRIAYAIDVDAIVPRNLGRLGVAAHGLIPTGLLGHEPASRTEMTITQPLNHVVRAQAMLHTLYEGSYAGLARDIMTTFAACGVELEVAAKRAEFLRANATESTDIFFGRWVADYSDTDGFVYTLLHTDSQWGRMCGTKETDLLLERARRETDPRTRHRIYRELEQVIARRALIVPLFHEQAYRFAQPTLGGMQVRVTPPIVPYEYLQER